MSDIINVIVIVLLFLFWSLIISKFIAGRYATVKTVKAEVFDKYKTRTVSKYPSAFRGEHCIVVFATKNRKLSFLVSEISYNNYKIKEKGTLKYKGRKIISFQ